MEAIDKIRIGNTIEVFLPVLTNGEETSLVGRNISVKLFTPRGGSQKIEDVCIDADVTNVVKFCVEGTAQQYTGKYRAVVYENANRASQALFDKVAFELVPESAMEDYGGGLARRVVQLSADNLYIGGKDGVGISSIQFVGHVTGGNKYKILLTSGAEYFFLANDGQDGQDGHTPYIQDGYWYINGTSTGVRALGENGDTPYIHEGYWYINGTSTGIKADYATEEAARAAAEIVRMNAELGRAASEESRAQVEATRVANEQTRVSNESTRQSNESARQSAETARQAAYVAAENARDAAFAEKEATRDAANQAALDCADTLAALGPKIDQNKADIEALQEEVVEVGARAGSYDHIPLLGGQPMILFGSGAPVEANVPENWIGFNDGGFEWIGTPSMMGQQYIDTTNEEKYVSIKNGFTLSWLKV